MAILSLIARIAPLLGLLGTVLGMIFGFEAISAEESAGKQELASAIGVALVTTATGLIIAIPTLVSLTFLRSRIRRIQAEFEEIFIDVIKSVKRADAATSDAATESKEPAASQP
jgi:biopolymer transport protein ExbB